MKRGPVLIFFFRFILWGFYTESNAQRKSVQPKYTAYLFAYFTGNSKSEEAIRFALSVNRQRKVYR